MVSSASYELVRNDLIPVPGVMGSNLEVSGVITEKVILAAGLVQSTLWRGLA